MHYLDPVQYSSARTTRARSRCGPTAAAAPRRCGTWRRIEMKYADGCAIVSTGRTRTRRRRFLEARRERSSGLQSDIEGFEEAGHAPGPRAPDHRLLRVGADAAPVRAQREKRPPLCTLVNLGKAAVPARPDAALRPVKERFVGDEEANRLVDQPCAPLAAAGVSARRTTWHDRRPHDPRGSPRRGSRRSRRPPARGRPGGRRLDPGRLPGGHAREARRALRRDPEAGPGAIEDTLARVLPRAGRRLEGPLRRERPRRLRHAAGGERAPVFVKSLLASCRRRATRASSLS